MTLTSLSLLAQTRVAVGNGKLAIADICAIAALGARVTVDAALLPSSDANDDMETKPQVEVPMVATTMAESMPLAVARAVLLLQLHKLLRMKSTCGVVDLAQFLIQLLNQQITPLISSACINPSANKTRDIAALTVLAAANGQGNALVNDQVVALKDALTHAKVELPKHVLSAQQHATFVDGCVAFKGLTALVVGGARGLLPMADAVAALTCEKVQANAALFDADFVDVSRPHRGIVTSATNVRLMLDNSKYVNVAKDQADADCIRHIPQYHGPVRDAITSAYNTIEAELNAALASATTSVHPQALKTAFVTTVEGLKVLLHGSNERLQAANAAVAAIPEETCALSMVSAVAKALDLEIQSAMAFFDQEEEQIKARAAEKSAKAQEAAAKAAAAAAKEDEKLAAMSEAQRQKVLEKRRKKLEKQKEKDGAKKTTKEELKVGAGSAALRAFLKSHDGLNPLDFKRGDQSIVGFLEDLFVRLGNGGARRKPKIAKGAQDFLPHQMALREKIFNKIRMVFKRHAGVEIETPVFELKETLTGKYGEDSKLIYDLADQGGELLALRYDLTVPFARFMALHNPGNIKRYHIARVYRRDNPQMARGRFREFYQCDFDIAGTYAPMLADAEVLSIGIEVLQQFPEELGPFKVKLSHRLLLDAILAICGVPPEKFRTTCSAIDKLDKEPWAAVRAEMVDEKGIPEAVADRIEPFVCQVGSPRALHAQLMADNLFGDNADAKKAMDELALLFDYLDAMGVLDYVSFDLSLARGLDYYTGLIYEFVLTSPAHNVGSIAAGGRYDNLVGMFSATGQQIPCVGVSMGIERIFGILQAHAEKTSAISKPASQVLVASTGGSLLLPRLQLCKELWRANIAAEVMALENPKFTKQLHYVLEQGIPYMVVIGEDELANNTVKIKEMSSKEEVTVARSDMVNELLRRQCPTTNTLSM